MTQQQALRELRNRLGLTRQDLAALLGKKEASIERYEAELTSDLAHQLAELASARHQYDLRDAFQALGPHGLEEQSNATAEGGVALRNKHEREIVHRVLGLLRHPKGTRYVNVLQTVLDGWDSARRGLEELELKKSNGTA